MEYIIVTIPFTVFLLFWIIIVKKRGMWNITSMLIFTYALMGLCALLYNILSDLFIYNLIKYDIVPVLYFTALIALYLYGFANFDESKIKQINIPNYGIFVILCWVFVILSFVAIFHFLPASVEALTGDIRINRDTQVAGEKFVNIGVVNTISGTIATFYPVTLLMFYINLILRKKILSILLFISSTSYVFFVFAYVGRDGVLFWISILIFYYFIFNKYLTQKSKILIRKYSIITGLIFITIFSLITFSRFGDRGYPVIYNVVDYMGQQVKNFNDTFLYTSKTTNGASNFSFIYRNLNPTVEKEYLEMAKSNAAEDLKYAGVRSNVFGTFLKSLIVDFGKIGTIIFSLIYLALTKKFTKNKTSMSLGRLLIIVLLYQVVFHGVFYFRLYNDVGNFYILIILLLSLIFISKTSDKNKLTIVQNNK
jgi:oligosaccharide repeat unit polymerase